jgi:hypothetical protein
MKLGNELRSLESEDLSLKRKVQIANYFTLCTLHFKPELVAGAIELSNFDLIRDILKIVGFLSKSEQHTFS